MAGARKGRRFQADREMSEFFTELWHLDKAKCHHGDDYVIDLQGYTNYRSQGRDHARRPLFQKLDEEKVFSRATYKTFSALLDNYEAAGGEAEVVTNEERKENAAFIDAVMETEVMQRAYEYLKIRKKAPVQERDFKRFLNKTWFQLYRRTKGDRDLDSSGFEHVFVGEVKKDENGKLKVMGFHNWIQLYLQEKLGNLDYKGYYKRGTDFRDDDPRLITLQFSWDGEDDDDDDDDDDDAIKEKGSSFLGTSPEFEMAIYTVLYALGLESCDIVLDGKWKIQLICHRMGPYLASCYPTAQGYVQ